MVLCLLRLCPACSVAARFLVEALSDSSTPRSPLSVFTCIVLIVPRWTLAQRM